MWYYFPRLCLCSVQVFFFVCETPPLLFVRSCLWLYRRRLRRPPVDLPTCIRAHRAKRSRGYDQRSVRISDRLVVRPEIVDADRAESSERSYQVDAASRFKSFFSLLLECQRSACEEAHRCTYTGPSVFRQMSEVLRICSSFGRAGKPTIALKWGGRTNRAEIKRCGSTWVRADA